MTVLCRSPQDDVCARRPLRDRAGTRPRRHGARPPRPPARPRPLRGAQGAQLAASRGRGDGGPLRTRIAARGRAQPSQHRHRARLLRVRRHVVHRDGVHPARLVAPVGRPAHFGAGRRRARERLRRPRARARPQRRAPRPQAREPDGHRRRAREDHGLRDREGAGRQRHRGLPHRHRRRDRDAGLHGARAGDGRRRRASDRPLRDRRDRLRAVLGLGAVRQPRAARDPARALPGAAGCIGRARAGRSRADRRLGRRAAGEGSRRPARLRARRLGGARGAPARVRRRALAAQRPDRGRAGRGRAGRPADHARPVPERAGDTTGTTSVPRAATPPPTSADPTVAARAPAATPARAPRRRGPRRRRRRRRGARGRVARRRTRTARRPRPRPGRATDPSRSARTGCAPFTSSPTRPTG